MRRGLILCVLAACCGCVRYYKVSEPSGGRIYYTTKVDEQSSGAVKFDDMKTGSRITLQSSDVKEVRKADLPPELQTK
jgi:hypothetical protein